MKQLMTKAQLAKAIAKRTDSTQKAAAVFLDALRDVAIKQAKKNGAFRIPGVGSLVKSHRKARSGRNPLTGEAVRIPSSSRLRFSADPATAAAFGVGVGGATKKKSKKRKKNGSGTSGTGPRIW
jgi:DNA-binding protein HU-beta